MRNALALNANEANNEANTEAFDPKEHFADGEYYFGTNHFFKSNSKRYHNTDVLSINNGQYVHVFELDDRLYCKTLDDIQAHLIAAKARPEFRKIYSSLQGAKIGAASLAKGHDLSEGQDIAIVPLPADDFGVQYILITFDSAVYQGPVRWNSEAELSA